MTASPRADIPEPLITVQGLTVRYGSRQVASLPELALRPAECVALVGESGSGKTTCLLAILGLLNRAASVTGAIHVCGVDITTANEPALAALRGSRIALVMQSPQSSFNPTMRLGTLMRRSLARHDVPSHTAQERTAEALDSVRLPPDIMRRYPHEVSGGQAQRFAVALAVALGAQVIAADEPTSALDVTVQAEVMALLQRLRNERGMGLLLVSHDLALVSTVADRVVVMRAGEVLESGPARRVLTAPTSSYTQHLLAAVPTLNGPR